MKCLQCGGPMTTTRENVKYDWSGLPGITLMNVEVTRCRKCGEWEVAIPKIEGLHRLIAQTIIRKPARLTPAEIRFLRKSLGWSAADFARAIGTAPETVSRWETGATTMGVQADKLLRLLVVVQEPIKDYHAHDIAEAAAHAAKPLRVSFKADAKGWKMAEAA